MGRKLFIVGNGVDLNLKMKTNYNNFKDLIKQNDMELFYDINEQIFDGDEELWSSFRKNVMIEEHNNLMD